MGFKMLGTGKVQVVTVHIIPRVTVNVVTSITAPYQTQKRKEKECEYILNQYWNSEDKVL